LELDVDVVESQALVALSRTARPVVRRNGKSVHVRQLEVLDEDLLDDGVDLVVDQGAQVLPEQRRALDAGTWLKCNDQPVDNKNTFFNENYKEAKYARARVSVLMVLLFKNLVIHSKPNLDYLSYRFIFHKVIIFSLS